MEKTFKNTYVLGEHKVPVTISASWSTFGCNWKFLVLITVNSDGRSCDSIRHSDVTVSDLRQSFEFLDEPDWPETTPPDHCIGRLDNKLLSEIAASLTEYAISTYPNASAADVYYGV